MPIEFPLYDVPFEDPVLIFAVVMVLLVVVPLLSERLSMPDIVLYILAGTLVGPHVLGFLERDSTMILLGTVGLLYLIFLAGVQLDLVRFEQNRTASLSFGFLTFSLPFALGTGIGLGLGYSLPVSLLLASLFASHTLIAYPILQDLNIVKNRGMTIGVGGLIVTDPGALLVLAVVLGAHEGGLTLDFWLSLSFMVSFYLLFIYFVVPPLSRWFFRNTKSGGAIEYGFVLAMLFVCAYLANVAGLEPIIGAFLAGLALNRLIPENSVLMNRTKFIGEALFIPFFLLSVGMLVDVSAFFTGVGAWFVAGAMVGAVFVGKGAAAWISRYAFGMTTDETWTLFGLTVPQAAATLAVTLIAYDVGLFDDMILNGTVMMILVTCLVGPSLVERYGKRVARKQEQESYDPSESPQRILVPLANPNTANHLMDVAMMILDPDADEPIFPMTVVPDDGSSGERVAEGEEMLETALERARAADVFARPVTRVDMNVTRGILRAVQELRIHHIVIGWGGKTTPGDYIFGNILDRLLRETEQMILVSTLDRQINTAERLFLVFPPHIQKSLGFRDAVRDVKFLNHQLGTELVGIPVQLSEEILIPFMEETEPEVEVDWNPVSGWLEMMSVLKDQMEEQDLAIVLSARPGSVAWQQQLDRLPRTLTREIGNNFIVVYPPETKPASSHYRGRRL